ncbi:unnamed protein product [Discula destructiva]
MTSLTRPTKERVRLTGPEATAIPMVFLKAADAKSANPILGDPYAQQLLDQCDPDDVGKQCPAEWVDPRNTGYIMGRAKMFDDWCQAFLDTHKARNEPVTVLHIACGLDCRCLRVTRDPDSVRWIDVDQPLVVALRSRLVHKSDVPGDYTLRTLQLTRPGWLRDVPCDRPTLVIAEGLLMYLRREEGEQLVRDLAAHFGGCAGGQMLFDTVGSLCVRSTRFIKYLRPSKSAWTWGVDDVEQEIVALSPRLRLVKSVFWWNLGERHPPVWGELGTALVSLHPKAKTTLSFHRVEFG